MTTTPKGIYVRTEEVRRKISESHKGLTSPRKGIKLSNEIEEKQSKAHLLHPTRYWLGRHRPEPFRKRMSEVNKGRKDSEEIIKKRLRRNPKSSLELKFEQICQNNNLPYRFVGNGDFFIERKCPDFINCNGEKIAIEVYYRKHKEHFGQAKNIGIEQWKREREAIFSKYGWKLLFFDETQVNEQNLKRCLL